MAVKRARPEDQIQRAVFEHLRTRGASGVYAFHPPNGGWRSRVEARILAGIGVTPGTPDIFAVYQGRCFALELKAPEGKLSEAQRGAHEALRAAGAEVATCWGLDEALKQLEKWKLLKGRTQ
jgi:hypothetical protein